MRTPAEDPDDPCIGKEKSCINRDRKGGVGCCGCNRRDHCIGSYREGDDPTPVAEGTVADTDREVVSGTGAIAEVREGVLCATGVAGLAVRAV